MKKWIILGLVIIGLLITVSITGELRIRQSAVKGEMSARIKPGWYWQGLGHINKYRQVATIGIGEETGETLANIGKVAVVFNDGSKGKISALVRIKLPLTQKQLLIIRKEYPGGYEEFILAGLLPTIKNAIKLSANLRTAQEAYTTLALFQQDVEDQLTNGMFRTKSVTKIITNAAGDREKIKRTEVVKDSNNMAIRIPSTLQVLGCIVAECVISPPEFDPSVEKAIADRKDEAMKTELSKQTAIRAKQETITIKEQGKANVARAQYKEETIKARQIVKAEQAKEVAELKAKQKLEVAILDAKAAVQEKQANILRGQGEAARKKAVIMADGALSQKLEAYKVVNKYWADAYSKRNVPQWTMGGTQGGLGSDQSTLNMQNMIGLMLAKEVGTDLKIKTK